MTNSNIRAMSNRTSNCHTHTDTLTHELEHVVNTSKYNNAFVVAFVFVSRFLFDKTHIDKTEAEMENVYFWNIFSVVVVVVVVVNVCA